MIQIFVYIFALFLALAFGYLFTALLVKMSNDMGDSEAEYEDYADEPFSTICDGDGVRIDHKFHYDFKDENQVIIKKPEN